MLCVFLIEGSSHPIRNKFIVYFEGLQITIFYLTPQLISLKIGVIQSNSADPGCG